MHAADRRAFLPGSPNAVSEHVNVRGCEKTRAILGGQPVEAVAESEWHTEYSDLVLAVRVVDSMDEAIEHIHGMDRRIPKPS